MLILSSAISAGLEVRLLCSNFWFGDVLLRFPKQHPNKNLKPLAIAFPILGNALTIAGKKAPVTPMATAPIVDPINNKSGIPVIGVASSRRVGADKATAIKISEAATINPATIPIKKFFTWVKRDRLYNWDWFMSPSFAANKLPRRDPPKTNKQLVAPISADITTTAKVRGIRKAETGKITESPIEIENPINAKAPPIAAPNIVKLFKYFSSPLIVFIFIFHRLINNINRAYNRNINKILKARKL